MSGVDSIREQYWLHRGDTSTRQRPQQQQQRGGGGEEHQQLASHPPSAAPFSASSSLSYSSSRSPAVRLLLSNSAGSSARPRNNVDSSAKVISSARTWESNDPYGRALFREFDSVSSTGTKTTSKTATTTTGDTNRRDTIDSGNSNANRNKSASRSTTTRSNSTGATPYTKKEERMSTSSKAGSSSSPLLHHSLSARPTRSSTSVFDAKASQSPTTQNSLSGVEHINRLHPFFVETTTPIIHPSASVPTPNTTTTSTAKTGKATGIPVGYGGGNVYGSPTEGKTPIVSSRNAGRTSQRNVREGPRSMNTRTSSLEPEEKMERAVLSNLLSHGSGKRPTGHSDGKYAARDVPIQLLSTRQDRRETGIPTLPLEDALQSQNSSSFPSAPMVRQTSLPQAEMHPNVAAEIPSVAAPHGTPAAATHAVAGPHASHFRPPAVSRDTSSVLCPLCALYFPSFSVWHTSHYRQCLRARHDLEASLRAYDGNSHHTASQSQMKRLPLETSRSDTDMISASQIAAMDRKLISSLQLERGVSVPMRNVPRNVSDYEYYNSSKLPLVVRPSYDTSSTIADVCHIPRVSMFLHELSSLVTHAEEVMMMELRFRGESRSMRSPSAGANRDQKLMEAVAAHNSRAAFLAAQLSLPCPHGMYCTCVLESIALSRTAANPRNSQRIYSHRYVDSNASSACTTERENDVDTHLESSGLHTKKQILEHMTRCWKIRFYTASDDATDGSTNTKSRGRRGDEDGEDGGALRQAGHTQSVTEILKAARAVVRQRWKNGMSCARDSQLRGVWDQTDALSDAPQRQGRRPLQRPPTSALVEVPPQPYVNRNTITPYTMGKKVMCVIVPPPRSLLKTPNATIGKEDTSTTDMRESQMSRRGNENENGNGNDVLQSAPREVDVSELTVADALVCCVPSLYMDVFSHIFVDSESLQPHSIYVWRKRDHLPIPLHAPLHEAWSCEFVVDIA